MAMEEGDVFVVELPDGRIGAVRVLRLADGSALLATTAFVGRRPASITDPRLRETLRQNRFKFRGEPALGWVDGEPPADAQLLGNIPPTPAKRDTQCSVYFGQWTERTGTEAYLEWRWENDREAYRQEAEHPAAEGPGFPRQEGVHALNEGEFWDIMQALDWSETGDDDRVLEPAVAMLARHTVGEILGFEELLARLLHALDREEIARHTGRHAYGTTAHFSPDVFLYARCAVVARGQARYRKVLERPELMLKDTEFEPLLELAPRAYERTTGRRFSYVPTVSYETFANEEGWRSRPR